jgi:hypothetical protein
MDEDSTHEQIYKRKQKLVEENRQKFISWNVGVINNFFFVHMARMILSLV